MTTLVTLNTKPLTLACDSQTCIEPVFQFSSLNHPTIKDQMAYYAIKEVDPSTTVEEFYKLYEFVIVTG